MRYSLILLTAVFGTLAADRISVTTMACPSPEVFSRITDEIRSDYVKMNRFAQKNGCLVFDRNDRVQVVERVGGEELSPLVLIVDSRTGERYYVQRSAVIVEQPGRLNRLKF